MSTASSTEPADVSVTAVDRLDLGTAVDRLEHPGFAARLADYANQPINVAIKYMQAAINRRLRNAVQTAISKCLNMEVGSLEEDRMLAPSDWTTKVMTGLTGGVGGFFGMAALPIELPLTTMLMLRSIAGIARAEGEDLLSQEIRLACLEVFALGGRGREDKLDVDYYAVRMVLTRLTGEMAAYALDRGALNASSPIFARLVGEIVSRFGLAVSERFAAGAVPIIGALGGATVNMIFTTTFSGSPGGISSSGVSSEPTDWRRSVLCIISKRS